MISVGCSVFRIEGSELRVSGLCAGKGGGGRGAGRGVHFRQWSTLGRTTFERGRERGRERWKERKGEGEREGEVERGRGKGRERERAREREGQGKGGVERGRGRGGKVVVRGRGRKMERERGPSIFVNFRYSSTLGKRTWRRCLAARRPCSQGDSLDAAWRGSEGRDHFRDRGRDRFRDRGRDREVAEARAPSGGRLGRFRRLQDPLGVGGFRIFLGGFRRLLPPAPQKVWAPRLPPQACFAVQGSGFRVQGSGCRVRVRVRVQGSGFRVQGSGFQVQGQGFRILGSGFRVLGSGFRVQGSGLRVEGLGFRVWGSGFEAHHTTRFTGCYLGLRSNVLGLGFRVARIQGVG